MTDVHSKEIRSFNMSQIKGRDTKPEILVRKFLFSNGLRYRTYSKNLPGKPDIVLPKYNSVVFIHGCFWHGHENCKLFVVPKTRTEWWLNKINGNIRNDSEKIKSLESNGWKVFVIWGCELTAWKREKTLQELFHKIKLKNINEAF
jgi:DNA mismatch endonuclease (patch repair protein)